VNLLRVRARRQVEAAADVEAPAAEEQSQQVLLPSCRTVTPI